MSENVLRIGGKEYQAEVKEFTGESVCTLANGKEYSIHDAHYGSVFQEIRDRLVHSANDRPSGKEIPSSTGLLLDRRGFAIGRFAVVAASE